MKRILIVLAWALFLASAAALLFFYWRLVGLVTVGLLAIGLRARILEAIGQEWKPKNLAQVAERIHTDMRCSAGEAWGVLEMMDATPVPGIDAKDPVAVWRFIAPTVTTSTNIAELRKIIRVARTGASPE